ncbi:c-type cytochrome [Ideonella sp. YS5]|uniref:c-type cytochrome n=1 Tax=Ideonella sp. YS5 TaxID=3453714 RepID=UPI003EEEB3C8
MNRLVSAAATAVVAAIGLGTVLPAAAQFQKPEDAVKYRKAAMTVMATHFGRIAAMANGKAPFDPAAAQANAELVAVLSKLPFAGFIEGTSSGDTKAKSEIWSEPDKFKAGASKMQEDVAKLNVAARTGNLEQIKAAVGDVGKSCKSCHDNYRKE